jgi:hypothetical protein
MLQASKVTVYGPYHRGLIPCRDRGREFSLSRHIQTGPWVHFVSCEMVPRLYPTVKWPEREAVPSPTSNVKVMPSWFGV